MISIFLERVASGRPVSIHGDGRQTRDFVYVGDVVEILQRSLSDRGPQEGQAVDGKRELPVMNLGTGSSTDLLTLLDHVAEACGRSGLVEVSHGPRRAGDIDHSLADVSRLSARFGRTPDTPLPRGLAATLAGSRAGFSGGPQAAFGSQQP